MYILTFDTSLEKTYISLIENKNIVENFEISNQGEKYHSSFLMSAINEILKNNKISFKNIGALGVNVGPASFTGLRVSLTAARVIAQQLDIPIITVNTFEILSKISDKPAVIVTDARRGKIYYSIDNSKPAIMAFENLHEIIKDDYELICDNSIYEILKKGINYQAQEHPFGEYLAQCVIEKLDKDDWHWAKAKPLYIQPPPIHRKGKC